MEKHKLGDTFTIDGIRGTITKIWLSGVGIIDPPTTLYEVTWESGSKYDEYDSEDIDYLKNPENDDS